MSKITWWFWNPCMGYGCLFFWGPQVLQWHFQEPEDHCWFECSPWAVHQCCRFWGCALIQPSPQNEIWKRGSAQSRPLLENLHASVPWAPWRWCESDWSGGSSGWPQCDGPSFLTLRDSALHQVPPLHIPSHRKALWVNTIDVFLFLNSHINKKTFWKLTD